MPGQVADALLDESREDTVVEDWPCLVRVWLDCWVSVRTALLGSSLTVQT
jgi:hypothetical protein